MSVARRMRAFAFAFALSASSAALAQSAPLTPEQLAALRQQIELLRQQQEAQRAAMDATAARLADLERQVAALTGAGMPASAPPAATAAAATAPVETAAASPASPRLDRLDIGGDVRLRYEHNWGAETARDRGRGVIRARVQAAYAVNDWLTAGGQIVTGDPDDPNSADVSLSSFDDDLSVALDQAYLRAKLDRATLWGGKFANPFTRSDLVWDGDVSPQGAAATLDVPLGDRAAVRLAGLYFLVDESVAGPNSDMVGGQAELAFQPSAEWKAKLSAAYFDYRLRSVAGGDAGDFRSNLLGPDGRYLSDFDLIDGIASLDYLGFGKDWPLQLSGEYVRNLGAASDADTGYTLGLSLGQASRADGWKLGYSYMAAETDAVLAAFSHDNIDLATNYLLHGLSVDHALTDDIILNATLYHFRIKDPLGPGSGLADDWRNRLRLNLLVKF